MPQFPNAFIIDNNNFDSALVALKNNQINSSVIQFQLQTALTQDQLDQLQTALAENTEAKTFCLASCYESRLELLNIFRGLNGFHLLSLQMEYPLKLSEAEFLTVCDIIQDAKESLTKLMLSVPHGRETQLSQALKNNYFLNQIDLYASDVPYFIYTGNQIANRNAEWLPQLNQWVHIEFMTPNATPPDFAEDEDLELPLKNILNTSLAHKLYEALKDVKNKPNEKRTHEIFQIFRQPYSHPILQEIASCALGYFMILKPQFFIEYPWREPASYLLLLNAFKNVDLSSITSNRTRDIQINALASAVLMLTQGNTFPADAGKLQVYRTLVLNMPTFRGIIDFATDTLEDAEDQSSKNELKLLKTINKVKIYNPQIISYLLKCPSIIRHLQSLFPSIESFYMVEDGLAQDSSLREINLTGPDVANPKQQGIPQDLCSKLEDDLIAAPALIPLNMEKVADKTRRWVFPNNLRFYRSPKAESSNPSLESSNQLG